MLSAFTCTGALPTYRGRCRWLVRHKSEAPGTRGHDQDDPVSSRGFTCLSTRADWTCPVGRCLSSLLVCVNTVVGSGAAGAGSRPDVKRCWCWLISVTRPRTQLSAGSGKVGSTATSARPSTCWPHSPRPSTRLSEPPRRKRVLLDGTLLPIDRIAADLPYYSGKHKKHGMNVQVIADPFGRLHWASPALQGPSTTSVQPANTASSSPRPGPRPLLGGQGYQGASGTVRMPIRGRWEPINRSAGREPIPGQDPRSRRTSHRHPQDLAAPPQTSLLDHPHHGHRPGNTHPPSRQLNWRLKTPHWHLLIHSAMWIGR